MESILESLLFVVGDEGITFEQIKQILDIDDNKANEVINNLKNRYQAKEFGIDIKVLGERYKMITKVENKDYLQKLIDVTEIVPFRFTSISSPFRTPALLIRISTCPISGYRRIYWNRLRKIQI